MIDPKRNDNHALDLAARAFLSAIFISAGLQKIPQFKGTLDYAKTQGVPSPLAKALLPGAIATEILAGLGLLAGYRTRMMAGILASYLVPVTHIFHAFWSEEGEARHVQQINYLKNLAIIGGLAAIAAHEAGRLSLDQRLGRMSLQSGEKERGLTPRAA